MGAARGAPRGHRHGAKLGTSPPGNLGRKGVRARGTLSPDRTPIWRVREKFPKLLELARFKAPAALALRSQVGRKKPRGWRLVDTDCCQLGGGLGNPVFFSSGPRFPICRIKLGSFAGMGPEAKRAARLALNRPVSAPVLQFQARDAGDTAAEVRDFGDSWNPGPGLGPTRALRIAWEVCLGCLGDISSLRSLAKQVTK